MTKGCCGRGSARPCTRGVVFGPGPSPTDRSLGCARAHRRGAGHCGQSSWADEDGKLRLRSIAWCGVGCGVGWPSALLDGGHGGCGCVDVLCKCIHPPNCCLLSGDNMAAPEAISSTLVASRSQLDPRWLHSANATGDLPSVSVRVVMARCLRRAAIPCGFLLLRIVPRAT